MRSRLKRTHARKRKVKRVIKKRVAQKYGGRNDYDTGFDTGYNSGYNDALQLVDKETNKNYDDGFIKGYEKGLYDGGECLVDDLLPHDVIAPELTVSQIISTGLEYLRPHFHPLILAQEISHKMISALEKKKPLSIVRLGDGELLTLAQDLVLSSDEVKSKGDFLHYAGVEIPDLDTRNALVHSIVKADIVGVPKLRLPNYLPLMLPVFQAHGIDYKRLKLTYSTINYVLYTDGLLEGILQGRRIIVIGNQAQSLSEFLISQGMQVTEPIVQVHGVKDIPRVMNEVKEREFDLALVSAGIAAVIISEQIASELDKVALDFGHLANSFINGEAPWKPS